MDEGLAGKSCGDRESGRDGGSIAAAFRPRQGGGSPATRPPGRRGDRCVLAGVADRLTRELDFGCVWINTHIPLVAEMPHGGFKHSGYGKDLSMYGFEDYTRIKHVMSFIG